MIPSAKIAIRPRPPPLNRFSSPRMLLPPRFFWIASMALDLIPGAGMCAPSRYSARMPAVNRIFLRMSATLNPPRIVAIIDPAASALDELAGAPGGFDALTRAGAEGVRVNRERDRQLALGQNLDRDALTRPQSLGLQRRQGDRVACGEPGLAVLHV